MKLFSSLAFFLLATMYFSGAAFAKIYKWKDRSGVIHYSNVASKVPAKITSKGKMTHAPSHDPPSVNIELLKKVLKANSETPAGRVLLKGEQPPTKSPSEASVKNNANTQDGPELKESTKSKLEEIWRLQKEIERLGGMRSDSNG